MSAARWCGTPPHRATPAKHGGAPGAGGAQSGRVRSRRRRGQRRSDRRSAGESGLGRPGEGRETKSPGCDCRGALGGAHGTDGGGRDGRDRPRSGGGGADSAEVARAQGTGERPCEVRGSGCGRSTDRAGLARPALA